ncbi:Predicted arabinose efflux permease, MFS family [Quadrisphaera granulorum]|uniref:Putative MFS family arabinose efflux permease n=1 Tax=Quadrisphaera granulorum TaxID=317664 RepID=A0A316AKZ4_9ACTN|nr:putative MFS family arabinose efflux permease [Quadrisphaera granulorum]SZE97945.1 Predicted arabinose efflux permease, MFS family [Quadrisphaera granulorum]
MRVALVGAAGLLVLLGQLYLPLPLLPQLELLPGAGPGAGTAVMTAFALPYAAGFILLGPLTDRVASRAVAIGSAVLVAVGCALAAAAPTLDWLLAARALQGLGAAPFTPAVMVLIATRVAPGGRLLATSSVISAGMASAVVAQVVAQVAAPWIGVRGLFAASAGAAVLVAVVVALSLTGSERARQGAAAPRAIVGAYAAVLQLLARPRLLLLLGAALCYLTVFVGLFAALQLAPPAGVGDDPGALLALRAAALPVLVTVPLLAGRLSKTAGRKRAAWALAVGAGAALALGVATAAGAVDGGGVVAGVAVALAVVALAVAVAAPATVTEVMAAAPEARGAANALYSAAIFGGASLATPFAAAAVALVGPGSAFAVVATVGGVIFAVAAGLVLAATRAP